MAQSSSAGDSVVSQDSAAVQPPSLGAFHDVILSDVKAADALVVMSPGLGMLHAVCRFAQPHCKRVRGKAVFLLNAIPHQRGIAEVLEASGVPPEQMPVVLTNEAGSSGRRATYEAGGVIIVTSRILVVDLLMGRLPPSAAHAMVVLDAHRVGDTSTEAFILRMFKAGNPAGQVKGFSEDPEAMAAGFNRLEKLMQVLHVRKLSAWPRIRVEVARLLQSSQADAVNVSQPLTPDMHTMQVAIVQAMDACLAELRKVSPRLKGLVGELKTLRQLLSYLLRYDAVTFYTYLETLHTAARFSPAPASWMLTSEGDELFTTGKRRMFTIVRSDTRPADVQPSQEEPFAGLWVQHTSTNAGSEPLGGGVRDSAHTWGVLRVGHRTFLMNKWKAWLLAYGARTATLREAYMAAKEAALSGQDSEAVPVTAEQLLLWEALARLQGVGAAIPSQAPGHRPPGALHRLNLHIAPLAHLQAQPVLLTDLRPTFVVAYDPDPWLTRTLEVYKACFAPTRPLRVFYVLHQNSVEEHAYTASLKREENAFENLIRAKAHMALPAQSTVSTAQLTAGSGAAQSAAAAVAASHHGRTSHKRTAITGSGFADEWAEAGRTSIYSADSRGGGARVGPGVVGLLGVKDEGRRDIIVDMREFRSKLPSLLHAAGLKIHPITLTVGDFVLSPEVCVERKSVPDLYGSFASGRLFTQATAMTRAYQRPVLLIEFDMSRPFALMNTPTLPADIEASHIISKIVLLTRHFPSLRLMWSRSPHATVDSFMALKQRMQEPDAETAAAIGTEAEERASDTSSAAAARVETATRNDAAIDVLRTLPGVTAGNVQTILSHVDSLAELCVLPLHTLQAIMGKGHGSQMHAFLHRGRSEGQDEAEGKVGGAGGLHTFFNPAMAAQRDEEQAGAHA
ncbi:Ercc4 [Symbiodinium sp. KB8]|nr:Ercc4 [Symbiodinium sp. KB8]